MTPTPPDARSLEGTLRSSALAFPETTEDFPWGERAIKVKGKAFLFLRAEGGVVSFSVKLPDSAAEALELPYVEPTHYGLGKHGWVTATVSSGRDAPVSLFQAWIDESFRAVAPKRVVAQLDGGAQRRGSGEPANRATATKKSATKKSATRTAVKKAPAAKRGSAGGSRKK
jgi:predicted DNA-binding protein (MmcQ/YjbR family)